MRNSNNSFTRSFYGTFLFIGFILFFSACSEKTSEADASKPEVEEFTNIIWNVKAIHPGGQALDIKAFDEDGNSHEVKAIQNSDQDSFLDIKARVDGKELPVKILVSDDRFAPVKAIAPGGATYDVKAITTEGEKLDVKGISRIGEIVILKAISKEGDFYGVKAISPTGKLNDIKGIKINAQEREMSLQGHSVHAHIKAMHPAAEEEKFKVAPKGKKKKEYESDFERVIWNIKAVSTEGKNMDVKAFDSDGNAFDVKAIQDSEQNSFMSIRALVDGQELPVRIMDSTSELAPVKAVGSDGTIYDIKALTENDVRLDVKGTGRSGNIVHVKVVNENGEYYGVKAFAPDGKLNDVKGVKIFDKKVELVSQGNPVYAHLRAISQ